MTELLHQFIEALRNELRQYGEMLALLEQPPTEAADPGERDGSPAGGAIDAHRVVILEARAERHAWQHRLAQQMALPEAVSLAQMVAALPHPYRPLVQALIQENHELSQRVEQRAQQQQALLQRSVRRMQDLASHLDSTAVDLSMTPEAFASTGSPVTLAQDARTEPWNRGPHVNPLT